MLSSDSAQSGLEQDAAQHSHTLANKWDTDCKKGAIKNFRNQVFSEATLYKYGIEHSLSSPNLRRAVVSFSFLLFCTVAISHEILAGPRAYVSAQTGSDNNPCS